VSVHEQRGQVRQVREAMHSLFGTGRREAVMPELQPLPVTGPGFYRMTDSQYHADPCPEPSLSASFAIELVSSTPAHAKLKHPRLNAIVESDDAEHFNIGKVAHAVFLEGANIVEVLDYKDWRTNAAKADRTRALLDGRIPLLRKTWDELEEMLVSTRPQLNAHEDGREMFMSGIAEPVLVWREGDLWFRSRIDWLRTTDHGRFAIDDYKTTGTSADPEQLSDKTVWNLGWDVKASFYRRGLHALTGQGAEFRFAVQETYAPYALSVVAPGPSAEMLGDMKVDMAIARWRRGLLDRDWPGYPRRTASFDVPAWLEKKWADREIRNAD
jgi:hypothetical protein